MAGSTVPLCVLKERELNELSVNNQINRLKGFVIDIEIMELTDANFTKKDRFLKRYNQNPQIQELRKKML